VIGVLLPANKVEIDLVVVKFAVVTPAVSDAGNITAGGESVVVVLFDGEVTPPVTLFIVPVLPYCTSAPLDNALKPEACVVVVVVTIVVGSVSLIVSVVFTCVPAGCEIGLLLASTGPTTVDVNVLTTPELTESVV
jgi:hypothetical protein